MSSLISIYGIADRNKFKYPGFVHDHNLSYLDENALKEYYHLERITRIKYDNSLSNHLENLILNNERVEISPVTKFLFVNSFVGNSFLSKNGRIRFDCNNHSGNLLDPVKGYCWIQNKDWSGFEVEAYSISHEIAHAFSSVPFAGELKDNSLLVSFDGGSSLGNFAAFYYSKGKLIQLENHWELSLYSKLFNDNGLTFAILNAEPGEHCSVPGKLMGYASWSNTNKEIGQWLKENDYFKDSWGDRHDFILSAKKHFKWNGSFEDNKDEFLQSIAATMQESFKIAVARKIENLVQKTNADYLYYAGGCALNIIANAEIVAKGWFKDVFISPCCNDSGLSIGASAYWSFINGKSANINSSYLNSWNCDQNFSYSSDDIKATAELLIDHKVIGICNGYGEVGPRALGNRSILALANSRDLSKKISMDMKGREWYRPIAPIMLEKNTKLFTGLQSIPRLSKYMLLDFKILPMLYDEIQGVIHKNGTSRIQTIYSKIDNPFIFDLLEYLDSIHNIKGLINTSFNGKGEPIVQTIEDARISSRKIGLDAIVLNGKLENL